MGKALPWCCRRLEAGCPQPPTGAFRLNLASVVRCLSLRLSAKTELGCPNAKSKGMSILTKMKSARGIEGYHVHS